MLKRYLGALFLGATLFVIYCYTLLPCIGYMGDTVKFQFIGKILGIPHATGFPLYLIINHFFTTYIPFKTLAFRANLLSAVCSIIACCIMYRIFCDLFKKSIRVSLLSSFIFALTFTFWSQSLIAEVYTLNIVFLSSVLYFFIGWYKTKNKTYFLTACAFYALSFSNHPVMITLLPALIFLVYITDKTLFYNWKIIFMILLFILASFSFYFYFIHQTHNPDNPYIEVATPNLKSLFEYICGSQFKVRYFAFSLLTLLAWRLPLFLIMFLREFHIGFIAIFYGVRQLYKSDKKLNMFLLIGLVTNVIWAINYDIDEVFVYPMISYFIMAIYLGLGLDHLMEKYKSINHLKWYFAFIPVFFFLINYNFVSERNNTQDAHITRAILDEIEKDAVIVSPAYTVSEYFWYYTLGNSYRKDKNIHVMHCPDNIPVENIKAYIYNNVSLDNSPYEIIEPGLKIYMVNNFYHFDKYRMVSLKIFLIKRGKRFAKAVLENRNFAFLKNKVPGKVYKVLYKPEPDIIQPRLEAIAKAGLVAEPVNENLWLIKK